MKNGHILKPDIEIKVQGVRFLVMHKGAVDITSRHDALQVLSLIVAAVSRVLDEMLRPRKPKINGVKNDKTKA